MRTDRPADNQDEPGSGTRRIDIRELLGAGREAILLHQGEEYRLRITRNGKLILTK